MKVSHVYKRRSYINMPESNVQQAQKGLDMTSCQTCRYLGLARNWAKKKIVFDILPDR